MDLSLFKRRQATLEELAQGEMEMLAERERLALEELESGGMARSSDQDEKKVTEEQIKAQRALDFLPSRTQEVEERLEERGGGREASGAAEGRGQEVGLWTGKPVNHPTTYAPPALFSLRFSAAGGSRFSLVLGAAGAKRWSTWKNQAPMLQRRREELRRPQWMSEEEEEKARKEEERKEEYRQKQMKFLMMHDDEKAKMLRRSYELQMECNKMEAEMRSFQHENWKIESENNAIRKENELLRQRLKGYEKTMEEGSVQGLDQHGFRTPDEERKDAGRSVQDEAEGAREEPGQERPSKEKDEKQMELMMRMMSSMQKMIEKREESKEGDEEVEAVRKLNHRIAEVTRMDFGISTPGPRRLGCSNRAHHG